MEEVSVKYGIHTGTQSFRKVRMEKGCHELSVIIRSGTSPFKTLESSDMLLWNCEQFQEESQSPGWVWFAVTPYALVTLSVSHRLSVLPGSPVGIRGETVCTGNPSMVLKKMEKRWDAMGGDLLRECYSIPSQFIHRDYGCRYHIYTSDISRTNSLDGSSSGCQCMCALVWSRITSRHFVSVLRLNLASLAGTLGQGLSVCGEEVNSFRVTRQSGKFRTGPHEHFVISRMESKEKEERIPQLRYIPMRGRAHERKSPWAEEQFKTHALLREKQGYCQCVMFLNVEVRFEPPLFYPEKNVCF